MASSPHLTVLCVSQEASLLRSLGRLLRLVGCRGVFCSQPLSLPEYQRIAQPEILIIDQGNWPLTRKIIGELRESGTQPPIVLLVCNPAADLDPLDVLEVGVDDVLARPLRNAEVLSRLRAATRLAEWQRRMRTRAMIDPPTGLLSERGLIRRLTQTDSGRGSSWTLFVMELDLVAHLGRLHGRDALAKWEHQVAQLLQQQAAQNQGHAARLAIGRFALAMPPKTLPDARVGAESLQKLLAVPLQPDCPTSISIGIAEADPATPDGTVLLSRAHSALTLAQQNGGNHVVASGDFADELRAWKECVEHGNPFAGNPARDVMTPFTLWLSANDPIRQAYVTFKRTQLPLLPVLEGNGQLVGIVVPQLVEPSRATTPEGNEPSVATVMTNEFERVDADADCEHVMKHFFGERRQPVIIFDHQQPSGYVTFQSFAKVATVLRADSFQDLTGGAGVQSLLVPDAPLTPAPRTSATTKSAESA